MTGIRQTLVDAEANSTLIQIGLTGGDVFNGKVTKIDDDTFIFQEWRTPRDAATLTTFANIHIGPQPLFTRKKNRKEPVVVESCAFNTPSLTIATGSVIYVKEVDPR